MARAGEEGAWQENGRAWGSRINLPDASGVRGRVGQSRAGQGGRQGTRQGAGTSPAAFPDGWFGAGTCFLRYGSDVRVQDKRRARTDPGSGTAA